MEWWIVVTLFFGGLVAAFIASIPVAFSFFFLDVIAMYFLMGPNFGDQLIGSIYDSLATFTLTPVPLFVLMGEFLFLSGLALKTLDVMEKWLGKIPGRLSILSIVSGAFFAALSGSVIANTAMLGSLLTPEMYRRKYHKIMIVGPIVASGSLAMMIPPSSLTVVFGSLSGISIGNLLVAGFLPGLLMASLYIIYIVGVCLIHPEYAPAYEQEKTSFKEIIMLTVKHVLPLGIIIFLTVGVIFLGVATATEAAALGALASLIMAYLLGDFNMSLLKKSLMSSVKVTAMILVILAASTSFSQVLAFSGATRGMLELITNLQVSPFWILMGMLGVVFFLGCFIEEVSIMMICLPVFMPIVTALKIDPIWFGILFLLDLEIALLTPPVGLLLYTIKGVVPDDITMQDIWKAAFPYVICGLVCVAIIIAFPRIATILVN